MRTSGGYLLNKVTFFRLCGMQVYNVATGKYLCHNKYYGRSLSPESFKTTIAEFLINDSSDQVECDLTSKWFSNINFQRPLRITMFHFFSATCGRHQSAPEKVNKVGRNIARVGIFQVYSITSNDLR